MSEQQEAVAGTSSRRLPYAAPIYNCLKLWAFQLNSTLAAAACRTPRHPGRLRGRATDMTRRPVRELLPIPGGGRGPKRIFRSWQTTPVLPDASTGVSAGCKTAVCQKESVAPAGLSYCAWGCFRGFVSLSQKPRDNPLKKCRIRQNREERHV